MSIAEIRARCATSVTEMVSGAAEYGRSQQIIRDRAELLEAYDALKRELDVQKGVVELVYIPVRHMTERADKYETRCKLLEAALVYSAFAQHGTPLHMLPKGITLINDDRVEVVLEDGRKVTASETEGESK